MPFQNFRGADLKEALTAVRAALGPDALIGEARHVQESILGGGASHVEVSAKPAAGVSRRTAFTGLDPARPAVAPSGLRPERARAPRTSEQGSHAERAEGIERELVALRSMVEDLSAACGTRDQALVALSAVGVEGDTARSLAAGLRGRRPREGVRRALRERFPKLVQVAPSPIALPGPRLISCVGPTGVGKTTTLAKLAAQARLEQNRSLSIITMDTFRVGAVEQWKRYGALLGVPVHVAADVDAFVHALGKCQSELVLVDTPGRTQDDPFRLGECLEHVSGRSLHTLLVLPAWLRNSDVANMCALYDQPAPTELVVTKLDETRRPGGVLHAAIVRQLPFAYLCDGPRVPEDLADASLDALGRWFFPSES